MTKKIYSLPIEKDEFVRLRNGENITKVFNNGLDVFPLLVVAIGKRKVPEEKFRAFIEHGDNATSIVIDDKTIDKIENGDDVLRADYKEFEICIVSADKMRESGLLKSKKVVDKKII